MSAAVKLGSKLPGDFETNGLDGIVDDLLHDPKTPRIALVVFDVEKTIENTDTGDKVPVVRVRRFEPAGEKGEVFELLKQQFLVLSETRTGRAPLPYDTVEVVHDSLPQDDE